MKHLALSLLVLFAGCAHYPPKPPPTPPVRATQSLTAPVTRGDVDILPGGAGRIDDCLAMFQIVNPTNQPRYGGNGRLNPKQACTDGDPICDADGAKNGVCVFRVGLCLVMYDPQLPMCRIDPFGAVVGLSVDAPGPRDTDKLRRAGHDALTHAALEAFAGTLDADGKTVRLTPRRTPACTALVPISVTPKRPMAIRMTPYFAKGHDVGGHSMELRCR